MFPTLINMPFKQQDLDFQHLHEIVFPAEVRAGENFSAKIKAFGVLEAFYSKVDVWKISPFGIELLQSPCTSLLKKGDKIDLELTVGGQRNTYEGLVVDIISNKTFQGIIGIRLNKKLEEENWEIDRRSGPRWICHDQFVPSCVCTNPAKYNDFLYFRIRDISHNGFRLVSSLRNKFLLSGMRLDLQVSFPTVGNIGLPVIIVRVELVSENGKDYLSLGVEYENLAQSAKGIIGQYLLQFANTESLQELKNNGFLPRSVADAIDYSFVKSVQDYIEVSNLRFESNRSAGKVDNHADISIMTDIYDSRSRIIMGKYDGQVVVTSRLIFNEYDDRMEQEEFVTWPKELPRREQIVEVSRACTHSKFRGSDLLFSLFRFMVVVTLQSRRDWIAISTAPEMIAFYQKIGFRDTGLKYENPIYPGIEQTVMLANVPDAMNGRTVSALYWNVVWKDVTNFLFTNSMLKANSLSQARLFFYRLSSPLALLHRYRAKKPRHSKTTT